jgi:hydroxypyruvate reductase/glycerate 2-kinase
MPIEGVTFEEKLRVVTMLQLRGATIREVNCVRKHLSDVKGGGLVKWTKAGLIVTLAVSDVMGDALDVIASGPTAPDPTTYTDALRVLRKYRADESDPGTPGSVLELFREGSAGERSDTMKMPAPHVRNLVVGSIASALRGAERHARALGWNVLVSSTPVGGDTRELSRTFAGFVQGAGPSAAGDSRRGVCLLSGGETTTALGPNPGLGGRNQEMALGVLADLGTSGFRGACVLSGGTDGEDGPTDAAGAWIDEAVAARAAYLRLDPERFLRAHDSYRFFEGAGGHMRTGFTGTNVMDLRVALVDVAARSRAGSEERTIPLEDTPPEV